MSLKKIVAYSTILTVSFAMPLIVNAQSNKASADISDRCLQTVHEVNMEMNQAKGHDGNGGVNSFPELTYTSEPYKDDRWANAPDGYVISFSRRNDLSIDLKKASAKIINSCKKTVAVRFSFYNGEAVVTYGIVKGRIVGFKKSGCDLNNSTEQGAINRYGKLNWGFDPSFCDGN
jgi:hypothetical protein